MRVFFLATLAFIGSLLISLIIINNLSFRITIWLKLDPASADAIFLAGIAVAVGISAFLFIQTRELFRRSSKNKIDVTTE